MKAKKNWLLQYRLRNLIGWQVLPLESGKDFNYNLIFGISLKKIYFEDSDAKTSNPIKILRPLLSQATATQGCHDVEELSIAE